MSGLNRIHHKLTFIEWWVFPKYRHWFNTPEHLKFKSFEKAVAALEMLGDGYAGESITEKDIQNHGKYKKEREIT